MQVCVSSPSFSRNPILIDELRAHFPNARGNDEGYDLKGENLLSFLKGNQGAIIGREAIDAQVLDSLPELQYIAKYGVGLDNIDLNYAAKKGLRVAWAPGTNRRSVAELALCFLLGLSRNVFFSYYNLKQGRWIKDGGRQLSEKSVGIIGCGYTGSELIQLLLPFACKIYVNDILDKSDFIAKQKENGQNISLASKEEIYRNCDFISLHVPFDLKTKALLNQQAFEKMKADTYIINTSRGEIIDEQALKDALHFKKISGAALDVFAVEPLTDQDLLAFDNLVVSPHIGGNAQEAVLAMGRAAIANLCDFMAK